MVNIYKDKMLSRGEYLGDLYDIGFDRPESHAIRKDGQMYYAIYALHWNGTVELRGLESRDYHVVDYVNHTKTLAKCMALDPAFVWSLINTFCSKRVDQDHYLAATTLRALLTGSMRNLSAFSGCFKATYSSTKS